MDTGKLCSLAVSDSGFVFDPANGSTYTANETGLVILNRLKVGESVASIADAMTEEFDTGHDICEYDILQFIETLQSYRLV